MRFMNLEIILDSLPNIVLNDGDLNRKNVAKDKMITNDYKWIWDVDSKCFVLNILKYLFQSI